jgi:hypothetical protein
MKQKKKITGVNNKNKKKQGKGIISDIAEDVYRVGAKLLTGENVDKGNPFGIPQLNENFGIKDPRLIKFAKYAAPGTNV